MSDDKNLSRNIKVNNLGGVAQSLAMNMFGPFLGIYAIRMGANNTVVALLSSLPALVAAISSMPGALIINRLGINKRTTAVLLGINRAFFLLVAMIPFLPHAMRPWALVGLVGLMNLPGTLGTLTWQTLMAGLIPAEKRGNAFGMRNRLMTLAGFGPTLAIGYLLDLMPFPRGYQIVFSFAFTIALSELWFIMRLREGDSKGHTATADPISLRQVVKSAISNTEYSSFTLRSLLFYFSWQMGWPLFTIYQVRYLGADNTWTGLFSVSMSLASFTSYRWWGKLGDRVGTARGLVLATVGMALTPAFYVLAKNLWYIMALNLSVGFFAAGTILLLFNGTLEVSPEKGRYGYLALSNTLVSISATIAPLVGKWACDAAGIKVALLLTAALRLIGCALFWDLARRRKVVCVVREKAAQA